MFTIGINLEVKKKRIILANSNDSQRIGIVVSSLDELKSKGLTRFNLPQDLELHVIEVRNGKSIENDKDLFVLDDKSMLKMVSQKPTLDLSLVEFSKEQERMALILEKLSLTLDNVKAVSGNDLRIISDFNDDEMKIYGQLFDLEFLEEAKSIASDVLVDRQMINDSIIIKRATIDDDIQHEVVGGYSPMRSFVPTAFFSWKKIHEEQETTIIIGEKIDVLEVLFPTEIGHKIKGVNEEIKFLNVPEITHLFASKKIKEEKFLFTCNGAKYGQIHLPAVEEPLKISNRVFGVSHSTSIESTKWVFEITVYRTQADVQINHDSIYGIRVYQFFQGIKNEINGVIHKFEVSSNHKSIIEDDFLHFLDEIFASSERNGPMLQDIEYSTRLPSNYEVPCISGFKEIKGFEQGYRDSLGSELYNIENGYLFDLPIVDDNDNKPKEKSSSNFFNRKSFQIGKWILDQTSSRSNLTNGMKKTIALLFITHCLFALFGAIIVGGNSCNDTLSFSNSNEFIISARKNMLENYQLKNLICNGRMINGPGLADTKRRKKDETAVTDALRSRGSIKILYLGSQENAMVVDASPEVGNEIMEVLKSKNMTHKITFSVSNSSIPSYCLLC